MTFPINDGRNEGDFDVCDQSLRWAVKEERGIQALIFHLGYLVHTNLMSPAHCNTWDRHCNVLDWIGNSRHLSWANEHVLARFTSSIPVANCSEKDKVYSSSSLTLKGVELEKLSREEKRPDPSIFWYHLSAAFCSPLSASHGETLLCCMIKQKHQTSMFRS